MLIEAVKRCTSFDYGSNLLWQYNGFVSDRIYPWESAKHNQSTYVYTHRIYIFYEISLNVKRELRMNWKRVKGKLNLTIGCKRVQVLIESESDMCGDGDDNDDNDDDGDGQCLGKRLFKIWYK